MLFNDLRTTGACCLCQKGPKGTSWCLWKSTFVQKLTDEHIFGILKTSFACTYNKGQGGPSVNWVSRILKTASFIVIDTTWQERPEEMKMIKVKNGNLAYLTDRHKILFSFTKSREMSQEQWQTTSRVCCCHYLHRLVTYRWDYVCDSVGACVPRIPLSLLPVRSYEVCWGSTSCTSLRLTSISPRAVTALNYSSWSNSFIFSP